MKTRILIWLVSLGVEMWSSIRQHIVKLADILCLGVHVTPEACVINSALSSSMAVGCKGVERISNVC